MVPNADFFDARYFMGVLGNFTRPDPSNLSMDFWIPQTWNRYSYALNNPLEMVDQNGLWPWPIHNQIISQAFPGMSADQLKALRDASWNMDYGPGQQDASKSYQHGMSDGLTSQDPSVAEEEGNTFIAKNEQDAQKAEADWIASGYVPSHIWK